MAPLVCTAALDLDPFLVSDCLILIDCFIIGVPFILKPPFSHTQKAGSLVVKTRIPGSVQKSKKIKPACMTLHSFFAFGTPFSGGVGRFFPVPSRTKCNITEKPPTAQR